MRSSAAELPMPPVGKPAVHRGDARGGGGLGDEVRVPPTLQALLAARLDGLDPAERRVLGNVRRACSIAASCRRWPATGRSRPPCFAGAQCDHRAAQSADRRRRRLPISPPAASATRPTRHWPSPRIEPTRAVAAWLETHGGELVEHRELIGHHLEQACHYRAELGLPDDPEPTSRAARHLAAAGRRALRRSDYAAAARLLGRAVCLERPDTLDLGLYTELLDALYWARDGVQALHAAEDLAPRVAATGLPSGASASNATSSGCRSSRTTRQHRWRPRSRRHSHSSRRPTTTWRYTSPSEPVPSSRSVPHTSTRPLTPTTAPGTTPPEPPRAALPRLALSLLLPRLDDGHSHSRVAGSTGPDAAQDHWIGMHRAGALDDGSGRARPQHDGGDPPGARDRGGGIKLAVTTAIESAEFESLAGDVEAAARLSEDGCRQLEALGDVGFLSTALATARLLYELGDLDEASACARRLAELGGDDDAFTQFGWRRAEALVLARRGDNQPGLALAREAVSIVDGTEFPERAGGRTGGPGTGSRHDGLRRSGSGGEGACDHPLRAEGQRRVRRSTAAQCRRPAITRISGSGRVGGSQSLGRGCGGEPASVVSSSSCARWSAGRVGRSSPSPCFGTSPSAGTSDLDRPAPVVSKHTPQLQHASLNPEPASSLLRPEESKHGESPRTRSPARVGPSEPRPVEWLPPTFASSARASDDRGDPSRDAKRWSPRSEIVTGLSAAVPRRADL